MSLYTEEFLEAEQNPKIARTYARSNCRYCYGRGVETLSASGGVTEGGGKILHQQKRLCSCVVRRLKKEFSDG